MTTSIQERHDAKMRLRLDASDGALIFEDFIGALAYDIGCETRDPADVMNRLADLIEPTERTCRAEKRYRDDDSPPWPYYVCSECGASFCYVDVATEEGDESSERLPYCPGCGAKVVD